MELPGSGAVGLWQTEIEPNLPRSGHSKNPQQHYARSSSHQRLRLADLCHGYTRESFGPRSAGMGGDAVRVSSQFCNGETWTNMCDGSKSI